MSSLLPGHGVRWRVDHYQRELGQRGAKRGKETIAARLGPDHGRERERTWGVTVCIQYLIVHNSRAGSIGVACTSRHYLDCTCDGVGSLARR